MALDADAVTRIEELPVRQRSITPGHRTLLTLSKLPFDDEITIMLPALQSHRPKVSPPNRDIVSDPLHQQQTRQGQYSALHQPPRSQVEALSPFAHLVPSQSLVQSDLQSFSTGKYDPAVRHPVFFTERLQKAGTSSPDVVTNGLSPVAEGYAWVNKGSEGLEGGMGEMRTKL